MHAEARPDIIEPSGKNRDDLERRDWELTAESIVVRLRWFGIVMGYILVQTRTGLHNPSAVRAFLALGAGYAALDMAFHHLGEVFLKRVPLFVSMMEGVFIALLCYHDVGLTSPFRWYYLLSIICAAIRYRRSVAWLTCLFHVCSYAALAGILGFDRPGTRIELEQTLILLVWTTWATSSLAGLLRSIGARLEMVNRDLREHRRELEERVAERSSALRTAQARVIHQEKMAAFGLLAAGIAHEVGNPLAALSSLIQMLQRRGPDSYTAQKLELADGQLARIGRTIRELVDFSRPASTMVTRVHLVEVVDEAFAILKYYHPTKDRELVNNVADEIPPVHAIRDHLLQVILNLVINSIDATPRGGTIQVDAEFINEFAHLRVIDDGRGIGLADHARLFRPYFTTKAQGTGLGLFVSRQIVEEMGGSLTYAPDPERTGACFVVNLPVTSAVESPSFSESSR